MKTSVPNGCCGGLTDSFVSTGEVRQANQYATNLGAVECYIQLSFLKKLTFGSLLQNVGSGAK